jgi:MYXO-CTERM domain-containing protein
MRSRGWHWLHAAVAAQLVALGVSSTARAHGVWGHVHVTGWAIENLPPGELRDFFADDEVRQAAQFGAAYTDSGYAIEQRKVIPFLGASDDEISKGHAYSEHTHWEPFINRMVEWIRTNDPPPWTSIDSQKRVAFVMGAAAHGLQDEIFDSTFLFQSQHHDGRDAESADPGTDYLLDEMGYLRFQPPKYAPMETVREVYLDLGLEVSEDVINKGMETVGDFYLNPTYRAIFKTVIANGDGNPSNIPWVSAHFMDPDVPGSLISEIVPTAAHMMALWKRLHGEYDPNDGVVYAYPAGPRRLRSHDNAVPDSWVTLIFGGAVHFENAAPIWTDAAGAAVGFEKANTRWGGEYTRLIRLLPTAPLVPGAWYDAGLGAGVAFYDGSMVTAPFTFHFQVACADGSADCAELGAIPVPSTDGSGPPEGLWPVFPADGNGDGDGDGDGDGSGDGAGDGAGDDDGEGDGVGDDDGDGNADPTPSKPRKPRSKGCAVASTADGALAGSLLLGLVLVFARRRRTLH